MHRAIKVVATPVTLPPSQPLPTIIAVMDPLFSPMCRLFTRFDKMVDHHRVQKVETAGDCYIVACGLLADDGEGFFRIQVSVDGSVKGGGENPGRYEGVKGGQYAKEGQ